MIHLKYCCAIVGIGMLILPLSLTSQAFSAMTYNIRYDNPRDRPNSWDERKDDVTALINYYHPDIFGIQEGLVHQVQYLEDNLKNYNYIGVGRDDGMSKGEFTAIFYNTHRFKVIAAETFWLSESPEKISIGWNASMERICTSGTFVDKQTGDSVIVYNAHFDHIGAEARKHSSELIISRIIENHSNKKLILMGDLNAEPQSPPIQIINQYLSDSRLYSLNPTYGPEGTFNHFDAAFFPDRRIDYIFTKNVTIINNRHIDDRRTDNLWVSDHLPVYVTINY